MTELTGPQVLLTAAAGSRAYLWRPEDWPEIERVARGEKP